MPHLLMRNIDEVNARKVWKDLSKELSEVCDCPEDWFTVEVIKSIQITVCPVFVQINWFEGKRQKQPVVDLITDKLNSIGYEDVTIIFNDLPEKVYFENKKGY